MPLRLSKRHDEARRFENLTELHLSLVLGIFYIVFETEISRSFLVFTVLLDISWWMEKTGQIAALMSEKKLVNDGRLLMPVEVRENADVKEVLVLIGTGGGQERRH